MIKAINADPEMYEDFEFMEKFPSGDLGLWPDGKCLCLKAEVIVPKPKKFITEYAI